MEMLGSTEDREFFYTEGITVKFGGLAALKNVNMKVRKKEIRGLIGPNGAGKTTFFNMVSGFVLAESGNVFFEGENISKLKSHEIAERGIVRTFQQRSLVPNLTVLENVLLGCHKSLNGVKLWDICFRSKRYRSGEWEAIHRARGALETVGVLDLWEKDAGNLSFGQQTLVDIAKALVSKPKLLLLDEPAAGLGAAERKNVLSVLGRLPNEQGVSLLICEHVMEFVMEICENITVLNFGEVLTEGSVDYIRQHKGVVEAYLGHGGN